MAKRSIEHADEAKIKALQFDRHNPRMPDAEFGSEEEVVRHLVEEFDVEELVQSILSSGWIDYEPLIVQSKTNIVYEGNRRLAALRLIADENLRAAVNYSLPDIAPKPLPDRVAVRYVQDRREARRFIAFKHINGPFKWDAYAKAKYASEWLKEGEDINVVSRMLGDNHNTVRRLVNGFNILEQAQEEGFNLSDRTKKRFAFSHLYTAVSRPAVRDFLGVTDEAEEVLPKNPVPSENRHELQLLMSWLYGQESKKEPTLIASQNPNLNQLVQVIANTRARDELLRSRRLDRAYEQVEPPAERFKDALIKASQQCEEALGLSAHFNGDPTILAMGKNLAVTVRNLRDSMVKKSLELENSDL